MTDQKKRPDHFGPGLESVGRNTSSSRDLCGVTIHGKYRLGDRIGVCRVATLYAAERLLDKKKVAVAALSLGTRIDPVSRTSETHANIVGIHEVIEEEGQAKFVVIDLPPGKSLEAVIAERGKLEPGEAISTALQILSALHAIHNQGRVHGNLDPGNVFIDWGPDDRLLVSLVDIAPAREGETADRPYYLSPEQVTDKGRVDRWSDVWVVGVLLYEMLFGRVPFGSEEVEDIRGEILHRDPDFSAVTDELPVELVGFIKQALRKKPERRFHDVKNAIRRLLPLYRRFGGRMNEAAAAAQRDSLSFATLPGRASTLLQSHERKPAPEEEPVPFVEMPAQSPAPVAEAATNVEAGVQPSPAASTAEAEIDVDVDVSDYELEDLTDLVEKVGPDSVIPQTAKSALPSPTPARRLGKRILVASAAALAVVACLVVVAVFTFSDGEETGPGSNGSTDRTQPPPVVAETSPPAPETEEVTIVLSGLPQGAQIKMDGEVASPPITVSKSTEPVVVEVRAAGYAPFEKRMVPDMDREIVVTMEKKPEPVSVTKPSKKTAKKKVKPSKKKKVKGNRTGKSKEKAMAPNPWQ